MKQRLAMILMMLGLTTGFVFFAAQNILGQDTDGDGVPDFRDNCPVTQNPEKIGFASDRNFNFDLYVMNADGSNHVRLTNNPAMDGSPKFSQDGSKIVFMSERDGNREIYVMNADGSNQTNLTNNPADDFAPSLSFDGSKIAFTRCSPRATACSDLDIYVMNIDGSNQIRLTGNAGRNISPAFSPDGSKIAFTSHRGGYSYIYVMNADGSNETPLTGGDYPTFSPDGSKIAFTSRGNIYIMNADGSNQIRLNDDAGVDFNPAFSPDGSKIAFNALREASSDIYVMNADGSNQIRLTSGEYQGDWGPAWSRQADSDGDGIGDACENTPNRSRFLNFSNLVRRSNYFIEVNAGSNVPVTFSLNGFKGFDIYDAPPASQQISCFDKTPIGSLQPIQTFPSEPNYNSLFDIYLTTWKTEAAWAGTCRRLTLTFNDGTTKTMDYRFR